MRLRNKKAYYLKNREQVTDGEGGKYDGYSTTAIPIQANIYPASGKLQAEIYGERFNYILNMLCDMTYNIEVKNKVVYYVTDTGAEFCEGAGICVYVPSDAEPDYKIISIKPLSHLSMELEKI
jgi:hypothetical protein